MSVLCRWWGGCEEGKEGSTSEAGDQRAARGPRKQESAVSWPLSRGLGETRFSVARSRESGRLRVAAGAEKSV